MVGRINARNKIMNRKPVTSEQWKNAVQKARSETHVLRNSICGHLEPEIPKLKEDEREGFNDFSFVPTKKFLMNQLRRKSLSFSGIGGLVVQEKEISKLVEEALEHGLTEEEIRGIADKFSIQGVDGVWGRIIWDAIRKREERSKEIIGRMQKRRQDYATKKSRSK
jgi:alkylhydroperoxidase/carboxymuconolactone decarboxylase family protein YurZ